MTDYQSVMHFVVRLRMVGDDLAKIAANPLFPFAQRYKACIECEELLERAEDYERMAEGLRHQA